MKQAVPLLSLTCFLVACSSGERNVPAPATAAVSPDFDRGFYTHVSESGGVPVLASSKVSPLAVARATNVFRVMASARPSLSGELRGAGIRAAVISTGETTTDLPEYREASPRQFFDIFRRASGAVSRGGVITVGEENLLGHPGDPGVGKNTLVASVAVTVARVVLSDDTSFNTALDAAYETFLKNRSVDEPPPVPDRFAYWGAAVSAWFGADSSRDAATLRREDPALATLVASVFAMPSETLPPAVTDIAAPAYVVRPEFHSWSERFARGEESMAPPESVILPLLPEKLHPSLRPDGLRAWRSAAATGKPSVIYFSNASATPVRLWFLAADGKDVPYGRLMPREHLRVETYAGAVWRVAEAPMRPSGVNALPTAAPVRMTRGYVVAEPGSCRRVILDADEEDADFAAEGELEIETPVRLRLHGPSERTAWASPESDRESLVFIRNDGTRDIVVKSAGADGKLTSLGTLRPRDVITLETMPDHVWRLEYDDATLIGFVVASNHPGVFTITDKTKPAQ